MSGMSEDDCVQLYLRAIKLKKKPLIGPSRIEAQEAFDSMGVTEAQVKESVHSLLQNHPENLKAESIEALLWLADIVGPPPDYAVILASLLLATNHQRNEDIAHTLQGLRDARTVEALFCAALSIHGHLHYDEFFNVARKCTWALADIGTPEAFAKLQELTTNENPSIAGYAQKRIDSWVKERARKLPG
jgi:HEAT repeat protein